jgi:hypothetical protein
LESNHIKAHLKTPKKSCTDLFFNTQLKSI